MWDILQIQEWCGWEALKHSKYSPLTGCLSVEDRKLILLDRLDVASQREKGV